jgi:hypothetical protein
MFAIGCCGGLIPDAMRIIQKRHESELPAYVFSMNFWIGFVLLVLLGRLAAVIGQSVDWTQALAIGYAGPEFLSRAFATKPSRSRLLALLPSCAAGGRSSLVYVYRRARPRARW